MLIFFVCYPPSGFTWRQSGHKFESHVIYIYLFYINPLSMLRLLHQCLSYLDIYSVIFIVFGQQVVLNSTGLHWSPLMLPIQANLTWKQYLLLTLGVRISPFWQFQDSPTFKMSPTFPHTSYLHTHTHLHLCPCVLSFFLSVGGVKVVCEYMALQEGVVQEELTLVNRSRRDSSVKVRLHARVMGENEHAVLWIRANQNHTHLSKFNIIFLCNS